MSFYTPYADWKKINEQGVKAEKIKGDTLCPDCEGEDDCGFTDELGDWTPCESCNGTGHLTQHIQNPTPKKYLQACIEISLQLSSYQGNAPFDGICKAFANYNRQNLT